MSFATRLQALRQTPAIRYALLAVGGVLMLSAPLAGLLPGPGGIVVFAIGLGLALRNSLWAKRRYVAFKKQRPKVARWTDWGMRRASPKRRAEAASRKPSRHD